MRINELKIIFICFFFVTVAVLLQKQVVYYETYKILSEKNRVRISSIDAPRGVITDRNGVVLAGNKMSFEVALIPQEVKNRQLVFNLLSEALNKPVDVLVENYRRNYIAPFAPVAVAKDITKEEAIKLEERSAFLPGVVVDTKSVRFYPLGESTAHITGYLREISSEELDKLKPYGYRIRELIGKEGIEKTYNTYLKGERGGIQVEVDNQGRQVRVLGHKVPRKGNDVKLAIDSSLQEKAYQLIKDRKGAVTVINPHTGEILAMCSSPSFDPNIFARYNSNEKKILSLLSDSGHPFLNRNTQATYPPGSLFKILIAIAALQEGVIEPDTSFVCRGSFKLGRGTFACWDEDGHGRQILVEAIQHSCNVFFYNTGLKLGVDLIYKYAKEFGYSQTTGIDLPYEAEGFAPNSHWKKQTMAEVWYEGETVIYAIGQGYLSVTPLQVLRMVCAIANGGKIVKPYLVKEIGEISTANPSFKELGIHKKNIDIVKIGMGRVTQRGGTAFRISVDGLNIAGKTATAQVSQSEPHAWFSGFAPLENPKVAIIIILEHGGKGGLGAVDIAGSMFSFIRDNYNLDAEFPFGS